MPPYEYDNMADSAGNAAEEAYTSVLNSGGSPSEALSAATEAAGNVMTDMGADPGMVDTMVTSATEGFTSAMEANPGMDPMEAFDAAGNSVDSAFEAEYGPMDGPPTGMDGPSTMTDISPENEMDDGMQPPPGDAPMAGDMQPPPDAPPSDPMMTVGTGDDSSPVDYPPDMPPGMDEASSYMDQSSAEAMPEPGYDASLLDQPDVAAGDAAIPDPTPDDDTSGLA